MRWADVDLEARTLRVTQAPQRVGGKLRFVEPKSAQSRRTLPLPVALVAALDAHRERQGQERLAAGSRWRESGLVFTSSLGTPVKPRNATRSFKALLGRAALPDLRVHDPPDARREAVAVMDRLFPGPEE